MNASLEQYRIFREVARAGSFSAAAERLFITQPAVSQAIGKLEKDLSSKLFTRTARGVSLTDEGSLLLRYIDSALGLLENAEERFSELQGLRRGSLRIGASDTICRHFLLPYLSLFHEKWPEIRISVTNRTSSETVALLTASKVDIGFVNLPTTVKGDLVATPLLEVENCFVAAKGKFPEFSRAVSLSSLSDYPLLMLEQQSSTRVALDEFFRSCSVSLRPQIELGSLDLLLAFAAAGLGIATVTRQYAEEYLQKEELEVIETIPPLPRRTVGILSHKDIPLSWAAKRFIELLEQKS